MTKADWDALARYVRWVANEVGLRDWFLWLDHEPCGRLGADLDGHGSMAECEASKGRKHLRIRVCKDFREALLAEAQRQTIVHELLHAHFAAMRQYVADAYPDNPAAWEAFNTLLEFGVDAVAEEWSKNLPLVKWPAKRARATRIRSASATREE